MIETFLYGTWIGTLRHGGEAIPCWPGMGSIAMAAGLALVFFLICRLLGLRRAECSQTD